MKKKDNFSINDQLLLETILFTIMITETVMIWLILLLPIIIIIIVIILQIITIIIIMTIIIMIITIIIIIIMKKKDNFSINDQLLLETILFTIRGETIKYSSRKKKLNMEKEIQLEREIKGLEQNINDNLMNINRETIDSLIDKKNTLAELRQNKIDGVMLRSRCQYEDLGEKPSGYFLNLESRNYTNKVMTKIVDESGNEYTNAKDIIEQQR